MTNGEPRQDAKREIDNRLLASLIGANAAWPESARQQMMAMVDQISKSNTYIQKIIGTESSVPSKAGFVAEEMHAETFNLDSILQRKTAQAVTDNYEQWADHGFEVNDRTADIAIVDGQATLSKTQVKYYQDSRATANAMREIRDGEPHYTDADSFIGPSDQIHPTDGNPSVADIARQTRLKNADTRPDVAEAAGRVEERATDRLEYDGIQSRPTTKAEAHEVAKDSDTGREIRQDYQNDYMTKSTLQQMQRAAATAAGIAAVISGTLNTMQYLKLVREGKLPTGEAVRAIVKNTAVASADSALKAAAATGAVSVVMRLSADTVAQQAVNSMLGRSGVAGAAVCAVDLIECLVLVAAGKMTLAELETRTGKNILQTAGGVLGSSMGLSIASSLGVTAGFAPVLAGVAGGLVVGVAVTIAIENGIERPYREVMTNTASLTVAGYAMREATESLAIAQEAFAVFLAADDAVARRAASQLVRVEVAGTDMKRAIERL